MPFRDALVAPPWRLIVDNQAARLHMALTLTETMLALKTADDSQCRGFQPAFIDRDTETVYLSRFPDGRLAPCHLLDGLPTELVVARNERGRVTDVRRSVMSGFVHDGRFHTRAEVDAMLVSATECAPARRPHPSAKGSIGDALADFSRERSTFAGSGAAFRAV